MKKTNYNFNSFIELLFGVLFLFLASPGFTLADEVAPVNEFTPAQIFYIPLPENQHLEAMRAIKPTSTQQAPRPTDPMYSYLSIAVFADDTIIHYDQWENGFEPNIAQPHNIYSTTNPGGTQIWGDGDPSNGYPPGHPNDVLKAGSVILVENIIISANRRSTGYSNGVFHFDGGDKLVANKPIAVTRMIWDATAGTLCGDATEVLDTIFWGTDFRAPVGENIPQTTQNQIFEYTGFFIMAGQGGATVQIDKDNNGTFETTVVLAEGEGYLVNGGVQWEGV